MKKLIPMSMLLAVFSLPALPVFSAPLELLGVRSGSTHRMALGSSEITARVIETGTEGWVLFSVVSDDIRWQRGTRLWINVDRINHISTAALPSAAASAPATAPLSDSEIARLPCYSQVEAKDAQAMAKAQSFDRNQFLTECILNQRKKP